MKARSLIPLLVIFSFAAKITLVVLPTLTVGSSAWIVPIVISTVYLAMGVVIIVAAGSLAQYRVDFVSIILLVLFGTALRVDSAASNGLAKILKVIAWLVLGAVLLGILLGRIRPTKPTWKQIAYLLPAVAGGMLLAMLAAYVIIHKPGFFVARESAPAYLSLGYIANSVAYQASNAAVPEEFLFRGLFWGYLVSKSYSESKAAALQGVLFWIWHFDYVLRSPIAFWFLIPAVTVLYTWLAWRSRSLLPSITAHMTYNVFQVVLAVMLASRI